MGDEFFKERGVGFGARRRISYMRNGSYRGIANEAMESIIEETESPSREVQSGRYRQLKCPDGKMAEMCLDRIPNFHCKSLPSSSRRLEANIEDNVMHRRDSMYQSSSDVSRFRKLQVGRRKLDSAHGRDAFMSSGIADASSQPSTSGAYLFQQSCSTSTSHECSQASRKYVDLPSGEVPGENLKFRRPRMDCGLLQGEFRDSILELSPEDNITRISCTNAAARLLEVSGSNGAGSDCQHPLGIYPDKSNLPKSLSAKAGVFNTTCPSENVHGVDGKKKARSSSFKKMIDPFMKSRSLRNPSLVEKEGLSVGGKNSVLRKSLLSDISRAEHNFKPNCQTIREARPVTVTSSPTHLHAVLKLDPDNGAFGFEFCTKGPEEYIYANTWKSGNELNWIYTFYSVGKRSSTVARTSKDRHGCLPPIVGQMHVSSYLYSEVKEDNLLNKSATSEFVLYDIAHARRSSAVERVQCTDSVRPKLCHVVHNSILREPLDRNNLMEQQNTTRSNSDASASSLWSQEDLHPHLEVAAVVIQVPFHKTRSKELNVGSSHGTIKVVTASGAHGLPRDDESSPSPLLNRLKSGGACDCGGWDMSCPIVILDNAYDSYWVDSVMNESRRPMELFVQGNQEVLPALSMKADGKGHFSVDFHAQLSALQAFSVCISLLHCSEDSSSIGIEKFKHKLYPSSLKMVLKEEVRQLIDLVTPKEKNKLKRSGKKHPSATIGPSFSPMGRV